MLQRYPRSVWTGRATAVVATLLVAPVLAAVLLAPELRSSSAAVTATQLAVYIALLGAGVLLEIVWRVNGSDTAGWTSLCLTLYAVQGATLTGLRATDADLLVDRPGWILVVHIPTALLILFVIRTADHQPMWRDPFVLGLVVGGLVAALCVTATRLGGDLRMSSPTMIVVQLTLVALGTGIAHAAARLSGLPGWCVGRLAVGTLSLVTSQLLAYQPATFLTSAIVIATGIFGAVCVVDAAGASLRWALLAQRRSLVELSERLAAMAADEREQRARMHEIVNSIGGLAAASSLIHRRGEMSPSQRSRLEEMLDSESNRLARLLGGDRLVAATGEAASHPEGVRRIDLDQVLRPLVTTQEALGRHVQWQPSGEVVLAEPDALSEVVNILLDNAGRHAPDAPITLQVARRRDSVEIAVHDDGPGIPAEVRRRLFEWGDRGPRSNGQGIGLHLAHQLMASEGNSLRLDVDGSGTTFVIGLPSPQETA